jgi:hypothetical protein
MNFTRQYQNSKPRIIIAALSLMIILCLLLISRTSYAAGVISEPPVLISPSELTVTTQDSGIVLVFQAALSSTVVLTDGEGVQLGSVIGLGKKNVSLVVNDLKPGVHFLRAVTVLEGTTSAAKLIPVIVDSDNTFNIQDIIQIIGQIGAHPEWDFNMDGASGNSAIVADIRFLLNYIGVMNVIPLLDFVDFDIDFGFTRLEPVVSIDHSLQIITVQVPYGANLMDLKASFNLTPGASAQVNGITQISGVTTNNYNQPVFYKLIQGKQDLVYVVTVEEYPLIISDIVDVTIDEDEAIEALPFTLDIAETATNVAVTGSSDNTELIPDENIVFSGSGGNRTVTVTPAANMSGAATITIIAGEGDMRVEETFVVTVLAVNDVPGISDIDSVTVNEDIATEALEFTISDAEGAASLTLTGSSSNLTLVPNENIVFGGSDKNRTVTVTPTANMSGSAIITVIVSDGVASVEETFTVTVLAVNDVPTITGIDNVTVNEDVATGAVAFTVGDVETDAVSLTVTGSSDNQTLIANTNIVFSGSDANRTVTVTPTANLSGTATITVTVSDGSASVVETFTVTVLAVNDAPTVSNIDDVTINEDVSTEALAFTIGDVETSATSLTVMGSSSNTTLVPNANIVIDGSDANRTVTVTPVANLSGTATITLTVSDGSTSTIETFTVTVLAVNATISM